MNDSKDNKTRTERTLLRAACDFCAADADVQKARSQWRELHSLHDPYEGVCCLPVGSPRAEGFVDRPALPRSKWCEDCKRIVSEAVDYEYALWRRRQAKTRMIRAYKKLSQDDRPKRNSEPAVT
jgi:hypothetical protein